MKIKVKAEKLCPKVTVYFNFGEKLSQRAKELIKDFAVRKFDEVELVISFPLTTTDEDESILEFDYSIRYYNEASFFARMGYIGGELCRYLDKARIKFPPVNEEWEIFVL